jgi:RHS repeat-associated protein
VQHDNGARWWLDAAGQLTERHDTQTGVQRFTWDAFGRLAEFENTRNERWAYRYDALGRRIGKEALGGPYTVLHEDARTSFLWDGDTMCGEVRHTRSRQHGRFYAYHLNSFEPLAMQAVSMDEAAGAPRSDMFFYQNDPNGAPVRLRSGDGKIAWEAHYGVTGTVDHFEAHTVDQPIRLQGQYADNESGLRFNRHRYFDPQIGQFISQDPIGLRGGSNPYQFAVNTFGWVDPLGLTCSEDAAALRANMEAEGIRTPAFANAAHHIVMSNSLDSRMVALRQKMTDLGLHWNEHYNGVFLPRSSAVKDAAQSSLPAHSRIHTNAYKQEVHDRLIKSADADDFLSKLGQIQADIKAGTFPF